MNFEAFVREYFPDPLLGLAEGEMRAQIRRASEACDAAVSEILGGIANGGLDALGEAGKRVSADRGKLTVNTFPCGTRTDRTFPDYVGICCGAKTTLRKLLNSVEAHCRQAELELDRRQEKTVLILTDKWDRNVFRRDYEKLFLRYALRDNVLFLFVLVTDYGVTKIPFLPWDRSELETLIAAYDRMGGFDEDAALDRLLAERYCELEMYTRSKEGARRISYEFDFLSRTYHRETQAIPSGPKFDPKQDSRFTSGDLKAWEILNFASAVFDLSKLPQKRYEEDPHPPVADAEVTIHVLRLFGKEFVWGPGQGEFEKIRDAVENLTDSLKKERDA